MTEEAASSLALLVDGRGLSDYSATRGIGTYLRGLLPPLAAMRDVDLTLLRSGSPTLPDTVTLRRMARHAPNRWADREHDLLLPLDIRRAAPEVFLSPALDPPRRSTVPWVQTLHDVIPLHVGSGFESEQGRWLRYRPRFQRAAHIVAVSSHCARMAQEFLDVPADRISVALHGTEASFHPRPLRGRAGPAYLLYVGEYDKRKGYAEAFEVIAKVAAAGHPHRLKVAGRIAPWVRTEIEDLVRRSPRPDLIDLLGHVGHTTELPELYRGADVLTVTSRYEGFGLPAAEAMACGTPVVSFSNTSLTEVVGDGGILIADGDTQAFATAVLALLESPAAHAAAGARALTRAKAFDWQLSAQIHHDALVAAARR